MILIGKKEFIKHINKKKYFFSIDPNKNFSNQQEKFIFKNKPKIFIYSKRENYKFIYEKFKYLERQNIKIKFFKKYKKISNKTDFKDLKDKIKKNEVISFDLFDTLLNRASSRPDSLIKLVSDNKKFFFKRKNMRLLEKKPKVYFH